MKVAFYSTFILEFGGGFEKYVIETAAHLAELPDTEADVITMDDKFMTRVNDYQSRVMRQKIDHSVNYKEKLEDITKRLGKARYIKVSSFKELKAKLKQYDVIYCKNELREGFVLRFCVGYKNIPPVVFGGHTALKYPNPVNLPAKVRNYLYNGPAYKILAGGVEKFHVINGQELNDYAKLFPKKRVEKIYNPFDIDTFKANAKQHTYDLKTDKAAINVMWVGRLTEQKGVSDLVGVIGRVNAAIGGKVKVVWNIFGDGDQRPLVLDLVKSEKNVVYHGHVDQKSMASIYGQNQVFLSTSKWEGYPYTLIELQAFGLQAFAYDIPGPSDIFSEYDGGHIAEDYDQMVQLLTRALLDYKTPGKVPKGKPSEQFKPEVIYKQLHRMLQLKD